MQFLVQGVENDSGTQYGMHDGWVEAFEELDAVFAG